MEQVTIVNRTDAPREAIWDGKRYKIPVGKSYLPRIVADAAKRQNIVMGSEDPISGEVISLVGIEEAGDDCSLIDATPLSIERWNRSLLVGARPTEIVKGNSGIYSVRDALPIDSTFVKP